MTRTPSTIFVVRHGARLDAADRDWHLSNPAPYDPPLTYGGWNQAKALGARIATIISNRAKEHGVRLGGPPRKQKVVIHSSPFLRCLQTSVAVGAGMAQSLEIPEKRQRRSRAAKTMDGQGETLQEREEYSVKALGLSTPDQINIKTILRVDAFLGEWLSPEYFYHITAPPNSTLMVAAAKTHLLKKEDIQVFQPSTSGHGHFPGGWSKANASIQTPVTNPVAVVEDDSPLDPLLLMAPLRSQRSNSTNSTGDRSGSVKPMILSSLTPTKAAYDPPIPAYAIAPSDPIPKGYCVHARDSCTDIDLLWDSMRYPQDWGDGGELGEEWIGMHKRFRRGLSKMIEWYKVHTPEFHPDREDPLSLDHDEHVHDDDDDYDLTVIMVTHAAGCNALVGALTNQPVLLDFGLTSLSMAVRKESDVEAGKAHSHVNVHAPRSPAQFGLSDEYDMKILSSTEHLRAGVQATHASVLTSPHLVAKIPSYSSLSHTAEGDHTYQEPKRPTNSSLGSMRRSSLNSFAAAQYDPMSPQSVNSGTSTGLWSRTSTISSSVDEVPIISIGLPAHTPSIPASDEKPQAAVPINGQGTKSQDDEVPPLLESLLSKPISQRAWLWGQQQPPNRNTAGTSKRRWTLTQQDEFD